MQHVRWTPEVEREDVWRQEQESMEGRRDKGEGRVAAVGTVSVILKN